MSLAFELFLALLCGVALGWSVCALFACGLREDAWRAGYRSGRMTTPHESTGTTGDVDAWLAGLKWGGNEGAGDD